jgi:hypothetical protein
MESLFISLNDGKEKSSILEVTDTHYMSIPDKKNNLQIIITGNRFLLRSYLEIKQVFSPILITPQHRIYLNRLNS